MTTEEIFTNGLDYFIYTSIASIIIAILINIISRTLIKRFNKKYADNITTHQYLYSSIRFLVWLVTFLVIIRQIKPLKEIGTTLLGATSIIAIAVGIAAQATFGNYIAGFFLAIHQPFKVGDIIRIKEKNLSGTVRQITFRHTVLLTQEHTEIIIPNTVMNSAVIEDMSNGNYSELVELRISGNNDLGKVREIINEILSKQELVYNKSQINHLIIQEMNKEGYKVAFPIYTSSLRDFVLVRDEVLPKIYKEFKQNNIELL